MNIILYDRGTTHEFATTTVDEPSQILVAADGYWQPGDWRTDVRSVLAAGQPLGAVGIHMANRELASRDWADIARRLVSTVGWQGSPWIAVRTSGQSMVVLAANPYRPEPVELQRFASVITHHDNQVATAQPLPMRILDAHHTGSGQLAVLVDRIPEVAELRFTPHLVHADLPITRHPAPRTLYIGTHPDGYVLDLLDSGDGRGFNGDPFDLQLVDGTRRTVVGPYSSGSATDIARYLPDVHLGRITLHTDPAGAGGRSVVLTNAAAQRALFLAARQITRTNPAAVARASYTPGPIVGQPPALPQSTTTPRRRGHRT